MEIAIRNYVAGSHLLESDPQLWDAIVILDSNLRESEFVENHTRNNLFLRFDDVTTTTHGKRSPTVEDVKLAIQFATDSACLMVCCRAGQSRSVAIAFSIAFHTLGADAAIELLNPKRHSPNSLIIDLASSIIDDPMLATTFHNWQTANSHIKMIDYIDEIEREMDALESNGARNRIIQA